MPTYRSALPALFPEAIEVPVAVLPTWLALLLSMTTAYPNGSSFAVTSDAIDGYRTVWLSADSHERLQMAGLLE